MKHCLLCVDDEVDNVDALERLFRRKYKVLKATSPHQALDLLRENDVTVIISDQRMPQMTGVEFLAESIKIHPLAIRILLTGYTDIDSVVSAINAGQIYRYVTKPWDPVDLQNAVDKAVERFELGRELVEKNRALESALTELRTLDEAKSQFMILVNHELKTPLTSILSFSDLLAESRLDDEQTRMLSRVKSSAVRLQEMVSDALEYVSAETAQTRVDKKSLSAKSIFKEDGILPAHLKQADERKLTLSFDIEDAKFSADEKLLRNVFRRLAHNAIKFAKPGTEVVVRGEADEDGYRITIENEGAPISAEKIAQLLKPFTLNENALNHSVGTGMGLSICQALLKLQESTFELSSGSGKVRATFALPASGRRSLFGRG